MAQGAFGSPFATGTRVFLNDGAGNFSPSFVQLPRPAGGDWGSTSIQVADFDGDARADILVALELPNRRHALQLWLQKTAGTFVDESVSAFGRYEVYFDFWREFSVGDFDGDGDVDIYLRQGSSASPTETADRLRRAIFLNDGHAKFSNPQHDIVLSEETRPVFLVPLRVKTNAFTLIGYEVDGGASGAYTSVTPVTIELRLPVQGGR
ncbi:MAG: VCBS repeat-containing protein [Burkholderiaceae bacterium]|nr:VCBS repeat-containing protein [Burkholderiaceae bacterium]